MGVAAITNKVSKLLPGHIQKRDVQYGASASAVLDIYGKPSAELKPVIMFWHGGSWKSGNKSNYQFMADYMEKLGAIPVIVGYPLFPEQSYPGFITDAQDAVKWVHKNIAAYGGDPERIYVMGHSAGGHTAVMVTLKDMQHYIRGCIAFSAPITLARRYWEEVFGKDTFDKGHQNPVNHIEPGKRHRFLLVHGMTDHIVLFRDSKKLDKMLRKHGYSVEFIKLRFMGHFRIVTTMVRPLAYRYKVGRRVKAFISQ